MIKTQMFIAVALLVGVAIGVVAGEKAPAERPSEEPGPRPVSATIPDRGEDASLQALRRRVAELEKALAEASEKEEIAVSNAVADVQQHRPPPGPQGFRERMEEMKKNEPERYAQMTNRFAQWRARRAEQSRSKMEFLSSVDTSRMSAGARKTHAALQDLIAKREEIEEQLHQENLPDADRDRLMKEMWSTHHELQRLNGEERSNLLDETARALGFEGDDAKEITATIQEVIRATDGGWGGHRHGGPRGPHGGPRGR